MLKRFVMLGCLLLVTTTVFAGCSEGRHVVAFEGPHKEVELGYDVEVDADGSRDIEFVSDVDPD
jgi:hypothetical protein